MAKIASLDDDVLLKIFENAVQVSDCDSSYPYRRWIKAEAPLNLSRTCHHWRGIVLASGRFWTRFKSEVEWDMPLARVWLERSRNAILDLDFGRGYVKNSLLRRVFENQSRLGRLLIEGTEWGGEPELVMIRDLSNMTELTLKGVSFTVNAMALSEPLSQPIAPKLTKLIVHPRGGIDATLDLVEQCPNLVELSLSSNDEANDRVFRPISFPDLTTLSLGLSFGIQTVKWLEHLTAPSLRTLDVSSHSIHRSVSLPAVLADFLERSQYGAPVENLSLSIGGDDVQAWARFARSLPGLKDYYSDGFPASAHEYELLTIGGDSGDAWPLLQKFHKSFYPGDIDAMVDFLLSRLDRPHPFDAEVHIQNTDEDDCNYLREHEELSRWEGGSTSRKYLAWTNKY